MLKEYSGTLRAKVTILSAERARIEWINAEDKVMWTEECAPKDKSAFVSQIVCDGVFKPGPGYFVDNQGKRHFVLNAEVGRLGALALGR